MTLELNYDRSLHEMEHRAGPFDITVDMIKTVNASLSENGAAFNSDEGAKGSGFRGMIAPPTLCSIFVREVQLPDVGVEFGRTQMHAGQRVQPIAPIYAGDRLTASSHLKGRLRQDGPVGHHGLHSVGDHIPQPGRAGRRRSPGVLRPPRVTTSECGTKAAPTEV